MFTWFWIRLWYLYDLIKRTWEDFPEWARNEIINSLISSKLKVLYSYNWYMFWHLWISLLILTIEWNGKQRHWLESTNNWKKKNVCLSEEMNMARRLCWWFKYSESGLDIFVRIVGTDANIQADCGVKYYKKRIYDNVLHTY